jgi:exodeoxyribonuclease VII large subunit
VETVRLAGIGALYEKFERLKARLAAAGWFGAERKRPLPAFPRAVGIVTSVRAAALRDILTTLRRRWPAVPLILYPAAVQGEGAAVEIALAIAAGRRRRRRRCPDRRARWRVDRGPVVVQRGDRRPAPCSNR